MRDSDVAVAAAQAGAAVVRARFGTPLTRLAKSAMDFATDADIEAERGEELGGSGTGPSTRTWLIDPLCGTLNFAAQTPLFTVNVALREDGAVEVAAAADPLTGEVFWTDGRVAYQRRDGDDSPLSPSAVTRLVDLAAPTPRELPVTRTTLSFRSSYIPLPFRFRVAGEFTDSTSGGHRVASRRSRRAGGFAEPWDIEGEPLCAP